MATSSRQNSRFSSLKVFKFAAASKPPPLPPKDPYYLVNPSLPSLNHSLSPDSSSSQPGTPLSAQYATLTRSPSPCPSYAPSRVTLSPPSSSSLSPESAGFRKGIFKFSSIGRRPKTPKTTETVSSDTLQPSEVADDPSISLPWNFQHNIHVDEGFTGLPPTWSASLTEAGFSEEEIAAINARRAASRSRSTRSIYSLNKERAASPPDATQVRMGRPEPQPRSSSLQRGGSMSSASQTSLASSSRSRNKSAPSRNHSESSSSSGASATPIVLHHPSSSAARPAHPTLSLSSADTPTGVASEKQLLMSRSTPRLLYHVANDSPLTASSPPPAYMSPKTQTTFASAQEDMKLSLSRSDAGRGLEVESNAGEGSRKSAETSISQATSSLPSLSTAPRLSLDRDTLSDLSSWSETIMSALPSTITVTPPLVAKSIVTGNFTSSSRVGNNNSSTVGVSSSPRQLPPQKPIPKQELPNKDDSPRLPPPSGPLPSLPPSPSNSTLWNEVMSMVKTPDSTILVPASPVHATHSPDSPFSFDTPLSPVLDEFPPIPSTMMHDQMELQVGLGREKENRDSSLSTMTVTPATISTATVVKSARGNVIVSPTKGNDEGCSASSPTVPPSVEIDDVRSYSPQSAESHSSVSSSSTTMSTSTGTGSASSDSRPQTLTVSEVQDWKIGDPPKSKGFGYIDVSPEPSPRSTSFADRDVFTVSVTSEARSLGVDPPSPRRPSIVISEIISPGNPDVSGKLLTPLSSTSSSSPSPSSPAPRYPGWVSAVVAPLKEFINDAVDPRDIYADLREIAEGESGSVYAARVISPRTTLSTCVAIKNVPILPSGSPKLVDLRRELTLMRGVQHPHILTMDGVYVDLVEDSLWIRMDLMERSLADIIGLVEEGIMVQEKPIAQFASDVLHALDYLQSLGIAHRDLRSDNLLVNREGVVKIADFSSAVQVSKDQPNRSDPAGVVYWQPPEMRKGSYNALKTDVWSLGATVWELAQGEPPFSDVIDARQMGDQWPSLSQPEIYSRSFHDFLNLCSKPSSSRPDSRELLSTPFIRNASGRSAIINLLSDCRAIEERLSRRHSADSEGTVSIS